jgi:hypothetical protein
MRPRRHVLLALTLGAALAGCGSDATAPSSGVASASPAASSPPRRDPPPPSSQDPFAEPSAAIPSGAGPAPSSESEAMRERVVLDLLEGKRSLDDLPEVATEGGAPLDPDLRDRVAPKAQPPQLRMGEATVVGGLPPSVVKRIVRQNFGRYRFCYEEGLRRDPTLGGRLDLTFVIDPAGAVTAPKVAGDLPDPEVKACIGKSLPGLSFPLPEPAGLVRVTVPITFTPPT